MVHVKLIRLFYSDFLQSNHKWLYLCLPHLLTSRLLVDSTLLELYEFSQIIFIQRISLTKVPVKIELIKPNFACRHTFFKEQQRFLHPRQQMCHRADQSQYANYSFPAGAYASYRSIVHIGKKGVFYYYASHHQPSKS